MYPSEQRRFSYALLAGAGLVLLLAGGTVYVAQRQAGERARQPQRLPMGTLEQAYAGQIHFLDLKMSRAANLLDQEVTYVTGVLSNDGDRTIRDLEATIEFRDPMNQVVLRDTQRPLGLRPKPIPPLRRREFEFTFEHVPDDWNRQFPAIRVTGLVLE